MAQSTSETERLASEYVELWTQQDYGSISAVVSDSFVHETPAAPDGKVQGREGVEAFMREITTAFPDFEAELVDTLSSGERGMVETEFTMTHEGEFNGIPPTGREVEIRSLAKIRVADGKLQELVEYVNMQELAEQLGVTE